MTFEEVEDKMCILINYPKTVLVVNDKQIKDIELLFCINSEKYVYSIFLEVPTYRGRIDYLNEYIYDNNFKDGFNFVFLDDYKTKDNVYYKKVALCHDNDQLKVFEIYCEWYEFSKKIDKLLES